MQQIQQVAQQVAPAIQQVANWWSQPRDPGCMLGATAKGGAIGTGVGLVGGGIAGIGTGPGAAATAYAGAQLVGPPGAAAGYAVGLFTCMSSSGTGGTSSGGGTGEGKVRFGNNPNQEYHTFRHVEEAGIDKQAAEEAIRNDLAGNENTLPQGLTTRQVNVSGRTLQYNAFKLADGTINVGRITVH